MNAWAKQKAFTIVELLIVIVVIAILAAVTIVAFGNVQVRAENTKTVSSVTSYARALKMHASENGVYPVTSPAYPCLGNVSYCANMTDTMGTCNGSGRAQASTVLNSTLASVAPSLPAPSTQEMDCSGKMYSGAYYAYSNAGKDARIIFYLRGDVPCPHVSGLNTAGRFQSNNATVCSAPFPTI